MKSRATALQASVVCLSLLKALPAAGVDYTLQANATLRQEYNTNIRLLPNSSARPVWASDVEVNTSFLAATPAWLASATGRFDNWFYSPGLATLDGELQNLQNQYLDARYAYLTERSRWDLSGSYVSDTLLSSQTTDLLGIVIRPINRETKTVTPSWTYNPDAYTKVNLSYSYNQSDYPGGDFFFPNSTSQSVSTNLIRQAGERIRLTGQLAATHFETQPLRSAFAATQEVTDDNGNRITRTLDGRQESWRTINYLNFMLGFNYAFSRDADLSFSGGGQYSQSTFNLSTTGTEQTLINSIPAAAAAIDKKVEQTGYLLSPLFELSLHKKLEHSDFTLLYSHQTSPSVNSRLFTADRVTLNATHGFSQRLNAGLRFSYFTSFTPLQPTVLGEQRFYEQDLFQLGGDISYALAKNCVVRASYGYQLRQLPGTTDRLFIGSQDAHSVSLSLRYEFDQLVY